jgi:hypothetical protein
MIQCISIVNLIPMKVTKMIHNLENTMTNKFKKFVEFQLDSRDKMNNSWKMGNGQIYCEKYERYLSMEISWIMLQTIIGQKEIFSNFWNGFQVMNFYGRDHRRQIEAVIEPFSIQQLVIVHYFSDLKFQGDSHRIPFTSKDIWRSYPHIGRQMVFDCPMIRGIYKDFS